MADEANGTAAVAAPESPSEGASIGFQFETPPTPPPETPSTGFEQLIPESYKEREWVRNLLKTENPVEEFFKQHEHAQSTIGRLSSNNVIPGENATPEQIQKFRKAIGVPDTHDAYQIAPIEWSPEEKPIGDYLAATRSPEFMDLMKQTAHAVGITPAQFNKVVEIYDRGMVAQHRAELAEIARMEQEATADFEIQAERLFGGRKDQVMQSGQKILQSLTPDALKPALNSLPNEALMVLAGVLDNVRQKYIREDNFNQAGASGNAPTSLEDIQAEGRKLMAHPAYADPLHAEHEAVKAKVKQNYARLGGR
jgi:hypothetical protein